jgi:hypothetical protein
MILLKFAKAFLILAVLTSKVNADLAAFFPRQMTGPIKPPDGPMF